MEGGEELGQEWGPVVGKKGEGGSSGIEGGRKLPSLASLFDLWIRLFFRSLLHSIFLKPPLSFHFYYYFHLTTTKTTITVTNHTLAP